MMQRNSNRRIEMTKFKNSDRKLDDAVLDAVVGGAMEEALSPQLAPCGPSCGRMDVHRRFREACPLHVSPLIFIPEAASVLTSGLF
jgi:hypothetical protein